MDLMTLIAQLIADGTFGQIMRNPLAQFGAPARRYLGAELLPEQTRDENAYREDNINYRTVIANDGTRYSPSQRKGGSIVGSFLVELGDSDIKRELSGREYEALLKLLKTGADIDAMAQLIGWLDIVINLALAEHNERQRWQALVHALVARRGDGISEDVELSDPAGHRITAGGTWSDNAYDPFEDITTQADLLASKGYTVSRIVTSRQALSKLAGNANIRSRVGIVTVTSSGQIRGAAGRATLEQINGALASDGLPPIELYDLQYRTQTGSGYFLDRDAMVLCATTGRDTNIDLADAEPVVLANTLGYLAVGKATGQPEPGRAVHVETFTSKPPRVEAEGWQTSLPVITEPEAVAVISGIA